MLRSTRRLQKFIENAYYEKIHGFQKFLYHLWSPLCHKLLKAPMWSPLSHSSLVFVIVRNLCFSTGVLLFFSFIWGLFFTLIPFFWLFFSRFLSALLLFSLIIYYVFRESIYCFPGHFTSFFFFSTLGTYCVHILRKRSVTLSISNLTILIIIY